MVTKAQGLIAFCQVFVVISGLYLVVGLIKPKWAWLGDHPPGRHVIVLISLLMFMASWTGYSMLTLKPLAERQAGQQQAKPAQTPAPAATPVATTAPAVAETAKPVAEAAKAVETQPVAQQPAQPKKTKTKHKKPAEAAAH